MGTNLDLQNALGAANTQYLVGADVFRNDLPGDYAKFCDVIPNDTFTLNFDWIGPSPLLREWVGPRIRKFLRAYDHNMTFKKWEATLPIARTLMAYEKNKQVAKRIDNFLADNLYAYDKRWIEIMVSASGAGPTCYDGQRVFATSHPHGAAGATQSNWGTAALTHANYTAARLAMANLRMENGENYGIAPTHMVCGRKNEEKAKEILEAKDRVVKIDGSGDEATSFVSSAATRSNVWAGELELIIHPRLIGTYDDYWYLFDTSKAGVYPFTLQENRKPEPVLWDEMESPSRVEGDEFQYMLEGDFEVGAGMWQVAYANIL
jgi:phage major head subunit gpT-like protein